jgi:signal transduction histidine kinase
VSLPHDESQPTPGAAVLQVAAAGLLLAAGGGSWSIENRTVGMSAASASATSAPRTAKLMRVSGARLLRTRDRSAPLAVAGTAGAPVAPVSDAVEAQQRFLAYAAHELRGEITLQLTIAELALADPSADTAALREMAEQVAAGCERQERLLEALLTLARSEYGHLRREPVDLATTAAEVLRAHDHHGVRTTTALERARTIGDPQLVERVVANLVANAIRHNIPGGRVDIVTYTAAGRATFTIANTGPVIPAGELIRLFQPFQRLTSQAGPSADGVGLGLAIVQAIANAHDATLTAQARTGGGLEIDVAFPALH